MLPVDGRQLGNVKGELLKLTKKETADCQLWHNVARREERKIQKNKEIADCQTWHNAGRREEPKKQKNKEIADCQTWDNVASREEPKKSEEQRNGRLADPQWNWVSNLEPSSPEAEALPPGRHGQSALKRIEYSFGLLLLFPIGVRYYTDTQFW
ncbi:hypothetical protein AVEN_57768-1 [Araneus ventricosus]|uniref:Uncharacterized protein n=1 Tax=Araneus ventricosus TaxID=182803 RepID=A0A4Y2NEQ3_ARAVE|nr:hypothetical protein AVEN_57768-1 [Araneus ventricosus]